MSDEIPIANAADDPVAMEAVQGILTLYRMALAPGMTEAGDDMPMVQSYIITASAIMAGITLGHMIALGAAKDQDKRRAGELVLKHFRNGIEAGKAEARRAMLEQFPMQGRA